MSAAILGALLDSIASEVQHLRCLDLTRAHLAAPWFAQRGLPLETARTEDLPRRLAPSLSAHNSASYSFALIVCEPGHLSFAGALLDPGGLLLVFASHDTPSLTHAQIAGYSSASTVQDANGAWHLLIPKPTHARPNFDVTVLLTCRDQARATLRTVQTLAVEMPAASWELILIDRESWDGTPALLRALEGDAQLLRVPRDQGECRALQHGFSHVRGSICAIIDPRLNYSAGWIGHVVQAHRLKPRAIFLGQCEFASSHPRSLPIPPLAVPRDRLRELPLDDHWGAGPLFARWLAGRDDIYAIEEWNAHLEPNANDDAA